MNYGIQNEESDLRAHVCVLARTVYVFKTKDAAALIRANPDKVTANVKTKGIITAVGYKMPVNLIPGICAVTLSPQWFEGEFLIREFDHPTDKGNKAVAIVKRMLLKGCFPLLPIEPEIITDKHLQISGTDIEVSMAARQKIQVKCDYRGGLPKPQCTGNLFFQIAECNPFKYT